MFHERQPKSNEAITSVIRILNVCAMRKAYNGLLLSALKRSENLVSNPILVNARTNHNV